MIPIDYQSKYPYSPTGKMGAPPETNLVDPLIALAAIAASTTKVRLATGVNILSQTNPLYLAKQAASLDFVSNGRFMLGVGIGWLREEFDALGVSVRPARRALRRLRDRDAQGLVGRRGRAQERVPELVGLQELPDSGAAPRRADRDRRLEGQGVRAHREVRRRLVRADRRTSRSSPSCSCRCKKACAAIGRKLASVEISAMWIPAAEGIDAVKRYADLGVSRLVVPTFAIGGAGDEALDRFAGEVLAKLADQPSPSAASERSISQKPATVPNA